nr:MAG TPA: hypothetical protein [Crassvirales sp.]
MFFLLIMLLIQQKEVLVVDFMIVSVIRLLLNKFLTLKAGYVQTE